MHLSSQSLLAFWQAPKTLLQQKQRSLLWLFLYLLVGFAVFAGLSYLLLDNQVALKKAVLDYLFPKSWQSISEDLFRFFFESQAQDVLSNLILSGSLVVASVFLFPIKEKYSAAFEREQHYPNGIAEEFTLLMQGIEETRLFLFYLTAQMVILWIGYYPYSWANTTSITLSYLFLFYTFALDIISPTLQRHRVKYAMINKLLCRNMGLSLMFGVIYSLPALLISRWIMTIESLNLLEVSVILFLVNLVFIAIAIPAGTHIASRLLPETQHIAPVSRPSKLFGYTTMTLLLIAGLILHGRLIQSMHHKSQVLKANYSINWDSISADYSSLSNLFDGESFGKLSFELDIQNPTEFDLVFEDSRVLVMKDEQLVSHINVKGFSIETGETRTVTMQLDTVSNFSSLTDIARLLEGWRIELRIELFPGIPFIINLLDESNEAEEQP